MGTKTKTSAPATQPDQALPAPRAAEPAVPDQEVRIENDIRDKITNIGLRAIPHQEDANGQGAVLVFGGNNASDYAPGPRVVVYWIPPADLTTQAQTDVAQARLLHTLEGVILDLLHELLKKDYRITPHFGNRYLTVRPHHARTAEEQATTDTATCTGDCPGAKDGRDHDC